MLAQKLTAIIGILSAAAVLTGAAVVALSSPQPPPPATHPAAQPAPPIVQHPQDDLDHLYALADGQVLRLIDPPFPPARATWTQKNLDPALLIMRPQCIGFEWTDHHLAFHNATIGSPPPLQHLLVDTLQVPWYMVEGLDQARWRPTQLDIVVRHEATFAQRLQALIDQIARRGGPELELNQSTQTRPCIIIHGRAQNPGFIHTEHQPVLVLTQTPWTPDQQTIWNKQPGQKYPQGAQERYELLTDAATLIDTPILIDPLPWARPNVGRILIAQSALLKHTDPDYPQKLARIVDNIQKQIGGDWQIETRRFDLYTLKPAQL